MSSRTRVALATSLCLLAVALATPGSAAAESVFGRATGAVSGFFRNVLDLFRLEAADTELDRALESYAKGKIFTTYLQAKRLAADDGRKALRDEANLLAGLAAADAGIREEAVPRLRAVLDAESLSPYYAVALGALLDFESRPGNSRSAAEIAARYVGDFWERPRSPRQAAIKSLFLETGNLLTAPRSRVDRVSTGERDLHRRTDRPADRALYLAGLALLREHEFAKAAACLEALNPESLYYVYARYGLAQARFGLRRHRQADEVLQDVHAHPGLHAGEIFLRDRAALLSGQILHEMERDSAAIRRLGLVSPTGPFGLHAALLAAEIQADREQPALALVYLKERPKDSVEPKLVAHAAALDARLHGELGDAVTAVARLEDGIRVLTGYEEKLRDAMMTQRRLASLLGPLERRQKVRDRLDAWRRANLSRAIPELLHWDPEPGTASLLLASALGTGDDGEVPVIYYRREFDPFAGGPPPVEPEFEPPGDSVFPSLFRRSLGSALRDTLRYELELETAIDAGDPREIATRILDGDLRLRTQAAAGAGAADTDVERRVWELGFGPEIAEMILDHRPRSQILLHAVESFRSERAAERLDGLREAARRQLERWGEHQIATVKEAVREESRSAQDLRYLLEFELSQALAVRKDEARVLQGSTPAAATPPSG